ncbi:HAUS augmin-like complex subunit 1 [Rhizophlyctis rosea]|nr:HAUS augmin-like complex subunit 1 [Rhizophlyctis rosea]
MLTSTSPSQHQHTSTQSISTLQTLLTQLFPHYAPSATRNAAVELSQTPGAASLLEAIVDQKDVNDTLNELEQNIAERAEEEYRAEAQRLNGILSGLNITTDNLSKSADLNLQALVSLALSLGICKTSRASLPQNLHLSSYETAMTDLLIQERRAEWDLQRDKRLLDTMERRRQGLERSLDHMKALLTELQATESSEDEHLNDLKRNTTMLQQKGQEYEERLEYLESQYTPEMDSIRIEVLRKLEDEVRELANEVKEKEDRLKGFQDLPPDITLAKIKLEEKKHYLEELVQRRHELLGSIAEGLQY